MGIEVSERTAERVVAEMEALCGVSSPWGDHPGAERCIELVSSFLPAGGERERIPCSSAACAADLLIRFRGEGERRLLLLGHLDTVVAHERHQPLRRDGDRLVGSGSADMKGGVAVSLAVLRALLAAPDRFGELVLLLVCDEEWRTAPFIHPPRFAGFDACLCFEAGERTADGEEKVIVTRKGAGTLRVTATGRAAHSGSQPDRGANALLALAEVATGLSRLHDPAGPDRLTVVPTLLHAGEALNMVPPHGELTVDIRADATDAFAAVLAAVPRHVAEVGIEPRLERVWPAMDAATATAGLIAAAAADYGAPIVAGGRGGASDASHFAPTIPLTVDGLGPRGGGAHNPGEFVSADSLLPRVGVALAVARAALESGR
jgi:glutamate carboxypeptidase